MKGVLDQWWKVRRDIEDEDQRVRYQSARTAVRKHHRPGNLHNRNVFSDSSGGQRLKIKVSTGLVPSEGREGDSAPGFSPRVQWFPGHPRCSLACRSIAQISASKFT